MRNVIASLEVLYTRHLQKHYERTRKYVTSVNELTLTNLILNSDSLENAQFDQCKLINCYIQSTYDCCVFRNVIFEKCKFQHATFNDCVFNNCVFTQCEFDFSRFTCSTLYLNEFNNTKFIYSNFRCSLLYEVSFTKSNVIGSHMFDSTTLHSTSLDEVLSQHYSEGQILTEDLIGYTKSEEGIIIQLRIPKDAVVFSINNDKCRTNKAIVEKFIDTNLIELSSIHDSTFKYHVGDVLTIQNFNMRYNVECASGIHFFKTIEEARAYRII